MSRCVLVLFLAAATVAAAADLEERRLDRDNLGARGAAAIRITRDTSARLQARGWSPRPSLQSAAALVERALDALDEQWQSASEAQWQILFRQAYYAVERLEKESGIR